jgi:glycosyltransferase involved in cell wall biosynthesis
MIDRERSTPETALPRFALSIVIPVYNGAESIAELVHAIENLSIEGGHEIVLVEDGSPDHSLEICGGLVENARVPITLVSLARNYGEHNAVLAGMRHAGGAYVITMDDDLQNPPEEIERLLTFAQRSGKQVIYTYYDEKQHSVWRNSGAASPTASPISYSKSQRVFISPVSGALAPLSYAKSAATRGRFRISTD